LNSKLEYLADIFGQYKYNTKTKEAEFFCPFCFHYKKKLSINVANDYWKCWVCEKAGKSLFSLLQKTNATERQIQDYSQNYRAKNVTQQKYDQLFKPSLPEDYKPLAMTKRTVVTNRFFQYLERRGVSEETILHHKLRILSNWRLPRSHHFTII
jgi:ribosomal protein L37AE/L43A